MATNTATRAPFAVGQLVDMLIPVSRPVRPGSNVRTVTDKWVTAPVVEVAPMGRAFDVAIIVDGLYRRRLVGPRGGGRFVRAAK